jgi:hypothetical protein
MCSNDQCYSGFSGGKLRMAMKETNQARPGKAPRIYGFLSQKLQPTPGGA